MKTVREYTKSLPKLEKVLDGTSMCAMKWIHQYVNFESGIVSMCHNARHRYINDKDIELYGKNIFFNHPYEIERRREKLDNIKHSDCNSCWQSESKGLRSCRLPQPFYNLHRDRFDTQDHLEVMPTQLEISFSNLCDLKCIYCNSTFSSQWEAEDLKNKKVITIKKQPPTRLNEVFWQWLEEDAAEQLIQYYIMGGEPLLQPQFYEFLEKLIPILEKKSNRFGIKPELIILTNANTSKKYIDKWLSLTPRLSQLMSIQMQISIEGYQDKAEYIRTNLNWGKFSDNVEKIFENSKELDIVLRFSITHSVLSITSCLDLLMWIKNLKDKIGVDIELIRTHVSAPSHLSPWMLSKEYSTYIDDTIVWIRNNSAEWNYYADFLESISKSFGSHSDSDAKKLLEFFDYMHINRNLDVQNIFPEMKDYFTNLKKIYNEN